MDQGNRLFTDAEGQAGIAGIDSFAGAATAPTGTNSGYSSGSTEEQLMAIGEVLEVQGQLCVCAFSKSVRDQAQNDAARDGQMPGQIGSFVKMKMQERQVFAVVRNVKSAGAGTDGQLFAELDFIGELMPSAGAREGAIFRRGVTKFPMPGQSVFLATGQDMRTIFAPMSATSANIGYVYPTDSVKAAIDIDAVLSRHLAVLGSTGTGKSTVVSLILQKIVEQSPFGHVLIFDPHDEYSKAFPEHGVRHDMAELNLPFWLMNLEEHIEVLIGIDSTDREQEIDILKRVLIAARRKDKPSNAVSHITADSPVPYKLADFIAEIQNSMGRLEKSENLTPYLRLRAKLEELRADARYNFMFSGLVVSDDFSHTLSTLFRMPSHGRPVSILDLSGVPSDIVNVVVSVISRIAFDFVRIARDSGECRPLLLVCEEAHRYVPENPELHKAVKKVLDKIAKEGRKYGIGLCLVTQRPSDISESILSQCGTMLALRLNNERDQKFVEKSIPDGAQGFLNVLPSLRNRECLLVGEGISAPSRVMIYDVDPNLLPNSNDPSFSDIWTSQDASDSFVPNIVERWRGDNAARLKRG
ncbi:MAG: DUF87 domain-containing protein [Pseudomonadota bacterium]